MRAAAATPPKRDWYVWRDPGPNGELPNDWTSQFRACGASWTLDEPSGQFYLHSFMPEQPDLNWDNPEVEAAMHDVLRFWLDRGVDGFRLDAIHKIAKDPLLRDHVGAPRRHDEDWESIHARLRGIRRVVDEYEDRMIVGEVALQDLHRVVGYLESGDQLHLAHNFVWAELPWDADAFRTSIGDFEALADETAWPAWFLANHDLPRVVERFGPGLRAGGRGDALRAARDAVHLPGRGARAAARRRRRPSASSTSTVATRCARRCHGVPAPHAGFSTAEPWLPLVERCGRAVGRAPGGRSAVGAVAVPPARERCGATRRRCRSARSGSSTARPTCSPGSGRPAASGSWPRSTSRARRRRSALPGATLVLSTDPDRTELGDGMLGACEGILVRP